MYQRGKRNAWHGNLFNEAAAVSGCKPAYGTVAGCQFSQIIHPMNGEAFEFPSAAVALDILDKAGDPNARNVGRKIGDIHCQSPGAQNEQRPSGDGHLPALSDNTGYVIDLIVR